MMNELEPILDALESGELAADRRLLRATTTRLSIAETLMEKFAEKMSLDADNVWKETGVFYNKIDAYLTEIGSDKGCFNQSCRYSITSMEQRNLRPRSFLPSPARMDILVQGQMNSIPIMCSGCALLEDWFMNAKGIHPQAAALCTTSYPPTLFYARDYFIDDVMLPIRHNILAANSCPQEGCQWRGVPGSADATDPFGEFVAICGGCIIRRGNQLKQWEVQAKGALAREHSFIPILAPIYALFDQTAAPKDPQTCQAQFLALVRASCWTVAQRPDGTAIGYTTTLMRKSILHAMKTNRPPGVPKNDKERAVRDVLKALREHNRIPNMVADDDE